MTMDTQWSAGARNETLRRIADALERIAPAEGEEVGYAELQELKPQASIVPIIMFVSSDLQPEQFQALATYMKQALADAGFDVPGITPQVAEPTL